MICDLPGKGNLVSPADSALQGQWHGLRTGAAFRPVGHLLVLLFAAVLLSACRTGGGQPSDPGDPPTEQRAPEQPINLKAVAGDGGITLSWNVTKRATSYTIKRSTVPAGPFNAVRTGVATAATTDPTVTPGTTYYYVVSAVNSYGESSNSGSVSVVAKAGAAPAHLSVIASGSGRLIADIAGLDCSASCTANYPTGTVVTLTATPASGATFSGWRGTCNGSQPTCTVTVDDHSMAIALFSSAGYGPRVTPGIEPGVVLHDAPLDWSTSADGQLVENLIFHAPPKIRHARVTFRNCKWLTAVGQTYPGGDHWAFDPAITDDVRMAGLVFEHNDFADALPAFGSGDPKQPWIVRASIMRGSSDGYGDSAKGGSNVLIEDSSFVYAYPSLDFAHGDGLQSDVGDVVNFTVRYSYFDVRRTGSNAAMLQNESAANVGNWLIENNRIQSPSAYAIRARNLTGYGRVLIRRNMIDRTWIYGPLDTTEREDMIDWIDNVDQDGQPVAW